MPKPSERPAFILSAGLGTRLRPYTEHTPKPMVKVADRPLIDYTLDHLHAAGVSDVTLNLFHCGEVLKTHLQDTRSKDFSFTFSEEKTLMHTGGGMKHALHTMGGHDFFAINGDALWSEGAGTRALERLAEAWDPEAMDILLLLHPIEKMHLTACSGDYRLTETGRAVRALDQTGPYAFAGVRITSPRVFEHMPEGPFSFLKCMDAAQECGRLYGLVHEGEWHHISTAQDLERVDAAFRQAPARAAAQ